MSTHPTETSQGEPNAETEETSGPKRRKKTAAEKEALRLKALREKYGDSAIDRSEPAFSTGFPRNALACAFAIARKLMTSPKRKRVNPERIAEQASEICPLTPQQREELLAWLIWLKPRRYVASDPYSSPTLLWALSKAQVSPAWDGDPNGEWRAAAEAEHAKRVADKEADKIERRAAGPSKPSQGHAPAHDPGQLEPRALPREVSGGAIVGVQLPTQDTCGADESPPSTNGSEAAEYGGGKYQPKVSPQSPAQAIRRPALPNPAFANGELKANAFFGAFKSDVRDEILIARARDLANDQAALLKALGRTTEVRRCIEMIFDQIGLPVPEANS